MPNKEFPAIFMLIPVRDRAWILPYTLEYLCLQRYPKNKIGILFIVNDSTDNSDIILDTFKRKEGQNFSFIHSWEFNLGLPKDERTPRARMLTTPYMGLVKNIGLDVMLRMESFHKPYGSGFCNENEKLNYDYFFFMDSDILLTDRNALKKLIEVDSPIAGALAKTMPDRRLKDGNTIARHCYNFLLFNPQRNRYEREFEPSPKEIFEVNYLSGCMMIKKELCEKIQFGHYKIGTDAGEDELVMRYCQEKGYKVKIDPSIQIDHIMNMDMFQDYLQKYGDVISK